MSEAARAIFVTGTDTHVGKTRISCALLAAARQRSLQSSGMKPVASGSVLKSGQWRNEDSDLLHQYSSAPAPDLALINPYALPEPIAPQLAAEHAGKEIHLNSLHSAFMALSQATKFLVVEGVGGWSVPFSNIAMQAQLVKMLKLPVVMVVGIRLGCINHALLTARAIQADGCSLVGWIANRIDPEAEYPDEVIASIASQLESPLLADMAHGLSIEEMAARADPALDFLLAIKT